MEQAPLNNGLVVGVVVVIFLAFMLFAQFLYWTTQDQKDRESRELSRRLGTLAEKQQSALFRLQRATDGSIAASLDVMLRQAGSPYPMSTLVGRMAGAAAVGALAGVILMRSPLGMVLVIMGVVPVLLLRSQGAERARKLTEQLPDGLDLVSRSLQAGHGIGEAFRLVAEEAPLPLAQEFGRVYENDYPRIILADEISPDGCRLWDMKTGEKLDKDRFREDLGGEAEAYQEVARRLGLLQGEAGEETAVLDLDSHRKKRGK